MIETSFKIEGLDELKRTLTDMEKRQLPFATKEAINATAERIKKAEQGAMKQYFDKPTKWTLNSMRIDYAKKHRPMGRVYFKEAAGKGTPAYKYLSVEEQGGQRRDKGFEKWLRHAGYLPAGWYVVPARGARLNQYGDVSKGMHTKVLAALKSGGKTAGYFVPGPKSALAPGIYRRLKTRVRAVFIFVNKKPTYRPRLPWYPVAQKTFDRHFEREFDKAFERAIRTAR